MTLANPTRYKDHEGSFHRKCGQRQYWHFNLVCRLFRKLLSAASISLLFICTDCQRDFIRIKIATTKQPEKIYCFPSAVVPECASYTTLNASDRSVHHTGRVTKCDDNLKTGWYRFQGRAGKQLASKCPPVNRCNSNLTGWMKGKHPNVEDGIVKRQVCFHGQYRCCYKTITIDVRNCGAYFVYKLRKVPTCRLRYCGTG